MVRNRGPYGCPFCPDSFGSYEAVNSHAQAKHRTFRCSECSREFGSKDAVDQHHNAEHYFECSECDDESTTEREGNQRHDAVHRECPECDRKLKTKEAMDQHYSAKHCPKPTSSTSSHRILCEHCLVPFPSLRDLKLHKIDSHDWRCMKKIVIPAGEDKPSRLVRDDPERLEGFHSGVINDRHRDASQNTNIEVNSVATHLKPSPPSLAGTNKPIISSPPPEVVAPSITQDEIVSSTLDDKGFLTSETAPNLEDQTVRTDEDGFLSSKRPTLNILVEIDPEPHQGQDGLTYEIASDIMSPTMTVSSIESDEPEEKYDTCVSLSHSPELLNGSPLEQEQRIVVPPRGLELGDRESPTMSNAVVTEDRSRDEPNFQARNELGGITPSTTKEQCGVVRSGSPTSPTSNSQDTGWGSNQGELPHNPLRTRRSKTDSVRATQKVHFRCRICLSDPTPALYPTATHCGHLFCYECIAAEVLRTSRCPVCENVLALYCLFKLDVAM